ncbi:hypothetical protein E2P81_ATG06008 [Venturia nashicola]|nr:hypothetical protein E2P81_ATG06008 [Venturia nashicola]
MSLTGGGKLDDVHWFQAGFEFDPRLARAGALLFCSVRGSLRHAMSIDSILPHKTSSINTKASASTAEYGESSASSSTSPHLRPHLRPHPWLQRTSPKSPALSGTRICPSCSRPGIMAKQP